MVQYSIEILGYAVSLFCLRAIAANWGGFELLNRTGLPAVLFGAVIR